MVDSCPFRGQRHSRLQALLTWFAGRFHIRPIFKQLLLSGLLFGLVRKGALPMTINDLIALLLVTLFILVVLKA